MKNEIEIALIVIGEFLLSSVDDFVSTEKMEESRKEALQEFYKLHDFLAKEDEKV